MDLQKLADRAEDFNRNIDVFVALAIEDSEGELVDLNRSQMLKSKDAKGRTIKPPYTEKYAKFKGFRNPNLKVSGDFQDDMFLEVSEKEWFIESFDFKSPFLTSRYGNDIFGIAPNNLKRAQRIVDRNFLTLYRRKVWT